MAESGRTDSQVAGLVLLVIFGVLGFVAFVGRGERPKISEDAGGLTASALGYRQFVPYSSIDSVTLRHGLDGISKRRNGLQSGNTYAGRFLMEPYGEAMLFVDARRGPLVVVHTKEGAILLSVEDSVGAEGLAARTRQSAATARRSGASD